MENNKLTKKYGLPMAIAMVIGIVIGSGVFFKAEVILNATGGNMPLGIAAWIIGGLIMMACTCAFSVMASKYEYVNGIVDYSDVTCGKTFGYYVGWFMATIYYPTLASVLAWVSARYFCVLVGYDIVGPECMIISSLFLVCAIVLNGIAPKISEKVQVSATVIKLIPILLMAVIGTIYGLSTGMTVENFTNVVMEAGKEHPLFSAIVSTAFAYEGWIIATSINAELKDAKRNMPLALVIGGLSIILIYTLYYIGVAGVVPNEVMMASGQEGAKLAYSTIFGPIGGTILFVFVVISCLGTLNGIVVGGVRGFYSVAVRNKGPKPNVLKQVDNETNVPQSSALIFMLVSMLWLVYFYGGTLMGGAWFGPFKFDSSELPIVASYAIYLPILFKFMIMEKNETPFKRFVLPILACAGCVFMVIASIYSHGMDVAWFLLLFVVVLFLGFIFNLRNKKIQD